MFSRYFLIGAFCALLSNFIIIAVTWYGFGYVSASFIAFMPVLLVGYFLHCFLTYGAYPAWISFARYVCAMLANYPLWFVALYALVDLVRLPIEVAAPTTTIFLFAWNFISTGWVFSKFRFRSRN